MFFVSKKLKKTNFFCLIKYKFINHYSFTSIIFFWIGQKKYRNKKEANLSLYSLLFPKLQQDRPQRFAKLYRKDK